MIIVAHWHQGIFTPTINPRLTQLRGATVELSHGDDVMHGTEPWAVTCASSAQVPPEQTGFNITEESSKSGCSPLSPGPPRRGSCLERF